MYIPFFLLFFLFLLWVRTLSLDESSSFVLNYNEDILCLKDVYSDSKIDDFETRFKM